MKRRILAITIAVLMMAPLFISGCARDDVAIVRIQLENMPRSTAANSNSVFERVFRLLVPSAYAQWDYPNTDLQVILTAPDLEDVVFNMPYAMDSAVTIEVPAGPQRKITVYGFQDFGEGMDKTWGGHAEVDLNPGDVRDVQINMLPIVYVSAYFDQNVSRVKVNWSSITENPESTLYGVIGYRVYRSDVGTEGPLKPIGNSVGINSFEYIDDNSGGFVPGDACYYTVSVYTSILEGELSDPIMYEQPPY
ncbi:MAG: hypothetical protein KBA61_01945 [Spirochaetes bacterium]|nr:hypothetical protein [Spirochaetota bacterium]